MRKNSHLFIEAILHWRMRLALPLLATILLAACSQVDIQTPAPTIVQIGGASSMRPVLEALAADFSVQNPGILIEIQGGGSTIGEAKVREGRIRLGASTLIPDSAASGLDPETGDIRERPQQTPDVLQRAPIGVDAVAIVVNEHNPIMNLTSLELHEIYSGRILDWEKLGGNKGAIVLVSREDGSGTRAAFESRIMGDAAVSLTAIVMPTSAAVIDYVATNPMAIGYVSSAFVSEEYENTKGAAQTGDGSNNEQPAKVRPLAIDGELPTDLAVQDYTYPIIQPLFLVTRSAPTGWAQSFIDYALSPAGQAVVDRYHTPIR